MHKINLKEIKFIEFDFSDFALKDYFEKHDDPYIQCYVCDRTKHLRPNLENFGFGIVKLDNNKVALCEDCIRNLASELTTNC